MNPWTSSASLRSSCLINARVTHKPHTYLISASCDHVDTGGSCPLASLCRVSCEAFQGMLLMIQFFDCRFLVSHLCLGLHSNPHAHCTASHRIIMVTTSHSVLSKRSDGGYHACGPLVAQTSASTPNARLAAACSPRGLTLCGAWCHATQSAEVPTWLELNCVLQRDAIVGHAQ